MHDLNRIALNGLRAIEAVGRLGSLNAAAAELGVTPGALSQRISRTEAQLGQPVFHRSAQGLRPTETGALIVARLSRGMAELAAAVALADPLQDDVLNISAAPLFASRWLIWRLPRFQAAHPDIRVRIEPSVQMAMPGLGGIDVALRVGRGDWPGLRSEKMLDQRVMPVCAPALAARIREPADLLSLPVIRENDRLQGWREWLAPHGLSPGDLRDGPEYADGGILRRCGDFGSGSVHGVGDPGRRSADRWASVSPPARPRRDGSGLLVRHRHPRPSQARDCPVSRLAAAGIASRPRSQLAAVIGPVQQRLTLARAAGQITRVAGGSQLPDMTAHGPPAADLAFIIVMPAAHEIAAIPLKPAARVVLMQPPLALPFRQRLAGMDAEIIQFLVRLAR